MFRKQMHFGVFCILLVGMLLAGCGAEMGAPPDTTSGQDGVVGPVDTGADIVIYTTGNGTEDGVARFDFSRLFPQAEAGDEVASRDLFRFPNLALVNVSTEDQNGQTLASAVATKAAPTVSMTIPLGGMAKVVRFTAIGRNAAGTEITRAVSNFATATPGATLVVTLRLADTVPAIFNLVPAAGSTVGTGFIAGASVIDLGGIPSTQFYLNGLPVDGAIAGGNPQANVANAPVGVVTLRAVSISPSGGQNEVTWQVVVAVTPPANQPPTAGMAISPTSGEAPLDVDFDASVSSDSDGTIILYHWDFGDGSVLDDGPDVGHTYVAAGTYTVTLTVTDNDGASASATGQVLVSQTGTNENHPPNVVVDIGPFSGVAPLQVVVDASGSTDPDGDTITIETDWGEGGADSAGAVVSHTYNTAGSFTVTVTVTDSRGAMGSTSATIVVSEPSPSVRPEFVGWVGKVVTFTGGSQMGYGSVIVTVVTPPDATEAVVDVFLTTAPSSSLELTGTVDLTTAQFIGGWASVKLDGNTVANPGGSTGLWQYNDGTGHLDVANVTAFADGVSVSGAISADVSAVQDY